MVWSVFLQGVGCQKVCQFVKGKISVYWAKLYSVKNCQITGMLVFNVRLSQSHWERKHYCCHSQKCKTSAIPSHNHDAGFIDWRPRVRTWASLYLWQLPEGPVTSQKLPPFCGWPFRGITQVKKKPVKWQKFQLVGAI